MQALHAIKKHRTARSHLGIDAGRESVRVAQLSRNDGVWTAKLLVSWRVPRGTPSYHDDPAVAERLSRWLRKLNARGRGAVVGLSPPDIELHAMELPLSAGDDDGQRMAARFEVQRLMSFNDSAAEIDFWPVPASKFMSTTAIGVAALKSRLDSILRISSDAHLDCVQVDAAPCALARFATAIRGASATDDDVWGVLDLGRRMTRLILCVGETPVVARVFEYGGDSWTKKLASSLAVSEEAAERHKCDQGIVRLARSRSTQPAETARGAIGEMIYNVLRSDLNAILGEVERTYRYVLQCYSGRQPGPLMLTGGGAAMHNLDRLIADQLGIEVTAPSTVNGTRLGQLDVSPVIHNIREPISSFACAIGLAMSGG